MTLVEDQAEIIEDYRNKLEEIKKLINSLKLFEATEHDKDVVLSEIREMVGW